jgi:CheY-like chemotaxis protein
MCHALVIEDEFLIADYVAELAGEAGATSIDFAETERDAVAAARERKPDIILSDVKLLVGTGPAAILRIQEEIGYIPVIFITATPEACCPRQASAVVLVKPIRQDDFMREFSRLAAATKH